MGSMVRQAEDGLLIRTFQGCTSDNTVLAYHSCYRNIAKEEGICIDYFSSSRNLGCSSLGNSQASIFARRARSLSRKSSPGIHKQMNAPNASLLTVITRL